MEILQLNFFFFFKGFEDCLILEKFLNECNDNFGKLYTILFHSLTAEHENNNNNNNVSWII